MVAFAAIQGVPELERVRVECDGRSREEFALNQPGGVDGVGAFAGGMSELAGLETCGLYVAEERCELGLRGLSRSGRFSELGAVRGGGGRELRELVQRDPFDVFVQEPERDRGGCGAFAVAGPSVAGVDDDFCAAAAHEVSAAGAARESREKRGVSCDAGGPRDSRGLCLVPCLVGDEGGVRGLVGVLPDGEFSEVHAVSKERADAACGHGEVVSDAADGSAVDAVQEGVADALGVGIGDELAGLRVARVSERGLPALPHSGGGGPFAEERESFGVLFSFVFGDGEQDVAVHAAGGGRAVDIFADDDDPAAGCFDAIPGLQLLSDVAAESREVADDDGVVAVLFDAFDRGEQGGAFSEWESAADVQFGWQDGEGVAVFGGVSLEVCDLVAVGVHVVGAGLSVAEAADSDDACHSHRGTVSRSGLWVLVSLWVVVCAIRVLGSLAEAARASEEAA